MWRLAGYLLVCLMLLLLGGAEVWVDMGVCLVLLLLLSAEGWVNIGL